MLDACEQPDSGGVVGSRNTSRKGGASEFDVEDMYYDQYDRNDDFESDEEEDDGFVISIGDPKSLKSSAEQQPKERLKVDMQVGILFFFYKKSRERVEAQIS